MSEKQDDFKEIEKKLKNYKNYKIGIQNMKKQLQHLYPKVTASYQESEGSTGTFSNHSSTEDYALKRIEKREEMELFIEQYGVVIDSIDTALKQLDPIEKEFVSERYLNNGNMKRVAAMLGCSLRTVYSIREEVKNQFLITLKNLNHMDI